MKLLLITLSASMLLFTGSIAQADSQKIQIVTSTSADAENASERKALLLAQQRKRAAMLEQQKRRKIQLAQQKARMQALRTKLKRHN